MLKKVAVVALLVFFLIKGYVGASFPYTHDGQNHLARFANYQLALREGQFPPRWAPNLMNRYGYPVFNYNYPLANILSVPFSVVKIPYETTFKLQILVASVVGLVGMWWWLRYLGASPTAQLVGVVAVASSPYVISTYLFRGNIGEVWALQLLPWLFVGVEAIRTWPAHLSWWGSKLQLGWIAIWTAFWLSHNVTVVFAVPLLLAYALVRLNKFQLLKWCSVVGFAFALSVWFWLPAIAEKSAVVLDQAGLSKTYARHFPTIAQLGWSPVQFGFSYAGHVDSLSFGIGLAQGLSLVMLSLVTVKAAVGQRHYSIKELTPWLLLTGWGLVISQLAVTQWWWDILPLVRFIQFPWRLSIYLVPLLAVVVAMWWQRAGWWGKLVTISLLALQLGMIYQAQPVDRFHLTNADYEAFGQSTTTANENLPKTFGYLNIGDWQPQPQIVEGQGEARVQYWKGSDRRYRLTLTEPSLLVEPTMLYLGWQTTANGQPVTYVNDDHIQGRLAYRLPVGTYEVRSRFTQWTPARVVGNSMSLITGLVIVISVVWQWRQAGWKGWWHAAA